MLDSRGAPVEGLKEDDFVVKEEGSIQTVQQFEAIALPESGPSRTAATSFVSTNTRPQAVPRTRSFVIVFDDAQLSKPTAEHARDAVARFLRTGLRDDDEVLLVSTATGAWWSGRRARCGTTSSPSSTGSTAGGPSTPRQTTCPTSRPCGST